MYAFELMTILRKFELCYFKEFFKTTCLSLEVFLLKKWGPADGLTLGR